MFDGCSLILIIRKRDELISNNNNKQQLYCQGLRRTSSLCLIASSSFQASPFSWFYSNCRNLHDPNGQKTPQSPAVSPILISLGFFCFSFSRSHQKYNSSRLIAFMPHSQGRSKLQHRQWLSETERGLARVMPTLHHSIHQKLVASSLLQEQHPVSQGLPAGGLLLFFFPVYAVCVDILCLV